MSATWQRWASRVASQVGERLRDRAARTERVPQTGPAVRSRPTGRARVLVPAQPKRGEQPGYPGDFTGVATIEYRPNPDGDADPGEVVWAWVPYEEDPRHGKDRPVLVIGEDGGYLLALMLTSQDHDLDAAQEARRGRVWMDIGTGDWDRKGRPSEARLDRVLRLGPGDVRREGAKLARERFDEVADALRHLHGWR